MTNKEIARKFNALASIMELHKENPFKIRSYQNAYMALRKIEEPLNDISQEELTSIKGIGKTIYDKIQEMLTTGTLKTYDKYLSITPPGVVEMLSIKGFGPKKVRTIWKDLKVETIGELIYACNENRLVELKGFGFKTQETLKKQLEYYIDSKGKFLYANIEDDAFKLLTLLDKNYPEGIQSLVGEIPRKMPVINAIQVVTTNEHLLSKLLNDDLIRIDREENTYFFGKFPIQIIHVKEEAFGKIVFKYNSGQEFLDEIKDEIPDAPDEYGVFNALDMDYVVPEYRESSGAVIQSKSHSLPDLIKQEDIKGVVHNHSTYSDGLHTIDEMAKECISLGFEYLVMTDHSKAAFYANGLSEDRVYQQFEEIDEWNDENGSSFKIYKGIECDILNDGSMDYSNDVLKDFELVIASIHSNLRMDLKTANNRLVKAIENPHVHMLGHPTGRLLLSRKGYPIDHQLIIDACAANGTAIEINANPLRLDIDWTWIPYALEKGVKISINPDAHSTQQIGFIKYGVAVARKGGLVAEDCINAMSLQKFDQWISHLE